VAHGDGVWTALLAASRDDRIAALALIAGAGTSGVDLTLERQQRALDRMVVPDAEKQTKIDLQRRIHRAVITGTGWQGIPADVRKQAETPWFQSYLLFDPAKVMPRVKQPVLLVRGALDTQVSAAQHERLVSLARSRKGAAGKAVQERTFTGLNHLLVPATTGDVEEYASLKDRTLSGEPMEALAAWLRSTFAAFGKK
jgi:hypothetical protein